MGKTTWWDVAWLDVVLGGAQWLGLILAAVFGITIVSVGAVFVWYFWQEVFRVLAGG